MDYLPDFPAGPADGSWLTTRPGTMIEFSGAWRPRPRERWYRRLWLRARLRLGLW